jgi:Transposase, Mutator family
MPTKQTHSRIDVKDDGLRAGVECGEPGGRAARDAGAPHPRRGSVAVEELPLGVRDRLSDELIDELLAGARTEAQIVGAGGLLADLTRRLVERAMSAELTAHLGYEPHREPPGGSDNARNGTTPKTLVTEHGPVAVKTPRTATAASSRSWCARASVALRGLTTRSWRCTRAGFRCATSRRIWPRSTA